MKISDSKVNNDCYNHLNHVILIVHWTCYIYSLFDIHMLKSAI